MNLKGESQKDIQVGRIGEKNTSDVEAWIVCC